ncbi:unnamed protein product [Camellia sinensis]
MDKWVTTRSCTTLPIQRHWKDANVRSKSIDPPSPEGFNIELLLDVPNPDLPALGSDPSAAIKMGPKQCWKLYFSDVKFRYIAVGNEVDPNRDDTSQFVKFVLPAMQNVYNAIAALGLQDQIKVSTATYSALVSNPSPSSNGSFDGVKSFMEPIIQFLAANKSPLLANIYPYFAYNGDQQDISLPYALFTAWLPQPF